MKSGGPLPPVSPQRASERDAYQALRDELLGGPCQVCGPLRAADAELDDPDLVPVRVTCTRTSTELHHRRKLSSSGAYTNPANVVPSCHNGNQAVERYPVQAKAAGLAVRPGHPDWDALSARAWRMAQLLADPKPEPVSPPAATVSARPPAGPDPF